MTKHQWLNRLIYIVGGLFLIAIILNFGLNLWLKYKLPDFLQKKTDYTVNYDKMDVDIITGNIHISNFKIKDKQRLGSDKLSLDGSIKDLKVGRFGIWKALFHKQITPSDLYLEQPQLHIRLPQKKKEKTGSSWGFDFNNLEIVKGNIQVQNERQEELASLTNFSIILKGFNRLENAAEGEIPFEFDEFKMTGQNIYVKPSDYQLIKAQSIVSKDNGLDVTEVEILPLLTHSEFQKLYPNKKQQVAFSAKSLHLANIQAKSRRVQMEDLRIQSPSLTVYKNRKADQKEQKKVELEVDVKSLLLADSMIRVVDEIGNTKLLVKGLFVNGKNFVFDDKSAKEKVPFQYEKLEALGQNVTVQTDNEHYTIGRLKLTPSEGFLSNLDVKSMKELPEKMFMDYKAQSFQYKIRDWSFVESKLNLDVERLIVDGLNGSIKAPIKTIKKVAQESGIMYPVKFGLIQLKNSDFSYSRNNQPLALKGLNVVLKNAELRERSDKKGSYLEVKDYNGQIKSFAYTTKFYNMSASNFVMNARQISLNNLQVKPRYTRNQFIRMIPTERDLYDIKVPSLKLTGAWDLFGEKKYFNGEQLLVQGVTAEIFRSKIPKDDPRIKPMYSALLRSIEIPFRLKDTRIQNSTLVYEEDTDKSNGPGKLTFTHFNMQVQNLNSAKEKGKSTQVPIRINCRFMGVSPMDVRWNLDTASMQDAFTIAGSIHSLPANHINTFIEPYLKIRATGEIQNLTFDFRGNKEGISGSLRMKHQHLKVSILNEEGQKNKFLSSVANVFVKSNSKKYPEMVEIEPVKRDKTKSFFNMFWKGIEAGLKKTLII